MLLTLPLTGAPAVYAADVDPADFLPSGGGIIQTVQGDVDDDGRDDLVVLYTLPTSGGAPARASLLILLADDSQRSIHLFGEPPHNLFGQPTLDPRGTSELLLNDLTGDGRAEIVLRVTNQFQEPTPRTLLWVFGRGDVPVLPASDGSPAPPPWAGTGFRLEAFLEGSNVQIVPPAPDASDGSSSLRLSREERVLRGPDPVLTISETYTWRGDGFRLAARSLALPTAVDGSARGPETAVLSFYGALERGDIQAATAFLGDDLRAGRSSNVTSDPSAASREQRVEEVRLIEDGSSLGPRPNADRLVYVRVSQDDPRDEPGDAPATDEQTANVPSTARRHTFAGTWRTEQVGDAWRLIAADLHETADITRVADALPAGATIVQTASGDLRGRGVEDHAVLIKGPGRFSVIEPYVVFGGPDGLEPGIPLASFVPGGLIGGPYGTIAIADVTADGSQEVIFNGFVGAHSALLWVLRWDGSTLIPLFAEGSNSPNVDLADRDDDGVPEIVLGQSGYCGSYASSPRMTFTFRWEDGAYRPASSLFPTAPDDLEDAEDAAWSGSSDALQAGDRACLQHMRAMSHAFGNRPAEARTAYQAYAQLQQETPEDSRQFVRPVYLGAEYVEADLRRVLAEAERGQNPAWGPAERAIVHDLLGDALSAQANGHQYEAQSFADRGDLDAEREARRLASEARQAATREYQAALDLDPNDEEARRILGE